jgi:hypothetical protein
VELLAAPFELIPRRSLGGTRPEKDHVLDDALVEDVLPEGCVEDVSRQRHDHLSCLFGGDGRVDGGERKVEGEEGEVRWVGVICEGRKRVDWMKEK